METEWYKYLMKLIINSMLVWDKYLIFIQMTYEKKFCLKQKQKGKKDCTHIRKKLDDPLQS